MNRIPNELQKFLSVLLYGEAETDSVKSQRLLLSIGQDICREVTNGEWKFSKHILLCMTLRHLFRSKDLLTLLNRFGHCESYSFALELETAIAMTTHESSSILSTKMVPFPVGASVFHSEFDNFDQFVNDLAGKGSVHTAHGIMMQDLQQDQQTSPNKLPVIPRTKQRSWDLISEEPFEECDMAQRKSPLLIIQRSSVPGSESAYEIAIQEDLSWMVLRFICDKASIPAWGGFVSLIGDVP